MNHQLFRHLNQGFSSRRDFLQRAGLGCGTLALTSLMHQEGLLADAPESNPLAPKQPHFVPQATSVIWLFQTGSPSQVDTWDYKPELHRRDGQQLAGADPRTGFFTTSGKCLKSPFKFRRHGQSGTWVSEIFPHTAKHVDDMAFVYSMYSKSNNHTPAMLEMNAGMVRQGFPSMGSWVTYGLGTENANLPAFVVMHGTKPRGGDPVWASGYLPTVYQATAINMKSNPPIPNLARTGDVNAAEQRSMLDLLRETNAEHARQRPHERDLNTRIASYELAYRMQMAAPDAMDIRREPRSIQDLYGVNRTETAEMAKECLIARRLVERGVRFVQIFANASRITGGGVGDVPWDGHSDINANHRACGLSTDQPVAALLTDLKNKGLLDSTLVIWGGEFGRTSDSQGSKGRDHNPHALTYWMAGGGIKGGTHYGRSDDFGYKSVENRVSAHDLHATVLHLLGLNHERLTYRFNGRDFRLTDVAGRVLREIIK